MVPIVVAAPGYFGGYMSFGTLMMVVGAFNQVQSSLRWFVDNLPQIADWRATLLRVVAFRDALATVDTTGADTGRIEVVDSASGKLELDDLQLALPEACVTLDQSRVEISPGERIQILGEAASDKSMLFRALAGMWPWGGGTLRLPPRETMMFMPQRPYLPRGTLHAAVCYPAEPGHFDEPAVVAALERVDLGHLVPSLDRTERWDRQLPMDEQQRLAFARLLLHAPRWVVADDALNALRDSHRRRVLSFCDRELVGMTLIRLGHDPVLDGFWSRTLHIIERPGGPRLRSNPPPGAGRSRFAHRFKPELGRWQHRGTQCREGGRLGWQIVVDFATNDQFRVVQFRLLQAGRARSSIGQGIISPPCRAWHSGTPTHRVRHRGSASPISSIAVFDVAPAPRLGGVCHHAGQEGRLSGPDPALAQLRLVALVLRSVTASAGEPVRGLDVLAMAAILLGVGILQSGRRSLGQD